MTRAAGDALQVFHPGLLKKNPKQTVKKFQTTHSKKPTSYAIQGHTPEKASNQQQQISPISVTLLFFVHEVNQGIVLPYLFVWTFIDPEERQLFSQVTRAEQLVL